MVGPTLKCVPFSYARHKGITAQRHFNDYRSSNATRRAAHSVLGPALQSCFVGGKAQRHNGTKAQGFDLIVGRMHRCTYFARAPTSWGTKQILPFHLICLPPSICDFEVPPPFWFILLMLVSGSLYGFIFFMSLNMLLFEKCVCVCVCVLLYCCFIVSLEHQCARKS